MPCCDASKVFEGNVSTQDATVVRSLRGEGAILLGKTNIPEFAFHYDSNNLVYGATHNPHNPERSVGGSSGGEGAALATGISPFGVGSDYGGSIRVPAHFNGVTGLKPGRWVVPYGGHFPPAQAMSIQLWSEIGPMARYVDDLQLLLPIFAKPDLTTDPDVGAAPAQPDRTPGPLRVAIFDEDGICPVDPAIREAVRNAGSALAERGPRGGRGAPAQPGRGARGFRADRAGRGDVAAVARDRAARGGPVAPDPAAAEPARDPRRRPADLRGPASRIASTSSAPPARGWRRTTSPCARSPRSRRSRSAPR